MTQQLCKVCDRPVVRSGPKPLYCSMECKDARYAAARSAAARRRRMDRTCVVCGGGMPLDDRNGRSMTCSQDCSLAWRNARRIEYMHERMYGLSAAAYDALLEAQGGRCAICRSAEWRGKNRCPHVDHDHVTGVVRGLLCGLCNVGLGQFKDDPTLLRVAADYLERMSAFTV